MAGLRWPPEMCNDHGHGRAELARPSDLDSSHYSDDERSVAADSWSVKSEYGSTLDGDDPRQSDAVDAMAAANCRPLDYGSDREAPDVEVQSSMLGHQSHWNANYSDELANFQEHGDAGEIWTSSRFGEDVMDTLAAWTAKVCLAVAAGLPKDAGLDLSLGERVSIDQAEESQGLINWNVLDLGTGNGVLLHALAKHGFTDLTGTDYSEGAVELAKAVSSRRGFPNINFLVDDVLDSKLTKTFKLITDKGTLDAIGLHPDGVAHRVKYWGEVMRLLEPGGLFVITSCNNTKNELVEEVIAFNERSRANGTGHNAKEQKETSSENGVPILQYVDHVRTYPTFRFGGVEGSSVYTVAFMHRT